MVNKSVFQNEVVGFPDFVEPIIILSEKEVTFFSFEEINSVFITHSPEEFKKLLSGTSFANQKIRIVSKNLPCIHIQNEEDGLVSGLSPFQNKTVFKEKWVYDDVFCYFAIENDILKDWILLSNSSMRHYSSILHNYWLGSDDVFSIDFDQNFMHIYCKKAGKFIFYNKLFFENETDVHYILQLVRQKVFSNDPEIPLVFSGKINKESKIIKPLYSYYDNISFVNERFNELMINDKIIDTLHFDLYAISL
ncbi:MAG: DUF3822 family protein [Saprospiraceae bacterium]|nr:DUF3822 family protein [Saprospiraceae bacterium]